MHPKNGRKKNNFSILSAKPGFSVTGGGGAHGHERN